MLDASPQTQESQIRGRGRGRGRSRGGLGKYLRARGRGGRGRPAEFTTRLVLEGEKPEEETEEEVAERNRKFSRRELGSNADRYLEPEPEVGSDGKSTILFLIEFKSLFTFDRRTHSRTRSGSLRFPRTAAGI
jgi:hypothetical protein